MLTDTFTATSWGDLLPTEVCVEERTKRKGEPDSKWHVWVRNLRTFHHVTHYFLEPFYFSLQLQCACKFPGDLVVILIFLTLRLQKAHPHFPHSWSTDLSYWKHLVQHSLSLLGTWEKNCPYFPQGPSCPTWTVISFIFFPRCQDLGSWCQEQKQHHCFATYKAGCMQAALWGSGWSPSVLLPGDSVSWFLCNTNICPIHTMLGNY